MERRIGEFGGDHRDTFNHVLDCDQAVYKAESHLERMFWHYLSKCTQHRFDSVASQVPVGSYRLDGLLVFRGQRIGIEVDGEQYHNRRQDSERDQRIIADGHVDEIIRIQSLAILWHDRAFLRPMQEWHACFECRQERGTVSADEWAEIVKRAVESGHDRSGFLRDNELTYSIWSVDGDTARIQCPNQDQLRVPNMSRRTSITRRRR